MRNPRVIFDVIVPWARNEVRIEARNEVRNAERNEVRLGNAKRSATPESFLVEATRIERLAFSSESPQWPELAEHGRNKFRDGGMNMHRVLQRLAFCFGVHCIENSVNRLVAPDP